MPTLRRFAIVFFCFLACSSSLFGQQINITGTVKNAAGKPLAGAMVSIVSAGKSAVTDSTGVYAIVSGSTAVLHPSSSSPCATGRITLANGVLRFSVVNARERVRLELFDCHGRLAASLLDRDLSKGEYRISLLAGAQVPLSSQVYFLKAAVGFAATVIPMPFTNGAKPCTGFSQPAGSRTAALDKIAALVDSMLAGSVGYTTASLSIDSYTGVYDFVLSRTVPDGQAVVVQTSQAGDRLALKPALAFAADDGSAMPTITVDTSQKYQTILGFGAAFTEAAVYCMSNIGPGPRKEIMDLFFNPYTGAGFTMGRTQIGSSDFSVAPYFYDNTANDFSLNDFSIVHDQQWMIPMIQQAKSVPGADIKIFAAPWSPPPWMKSTNNWLHGTLLSNCYAAFGLYLCKYVEEMNRNGVDIWAITMQNEPAFDSPWYPSCTYTAQQERTLLHDNLGPQLQAEGLLNKVKVMIWDHNKDLLNAWGNTIIGDTAAGKYALGAAYHWYSGDMFDSLTAFHNSYASKLLVETEVAEPFKGYNADGSYKVDWGQAEREGHDLIGDMNHWSNGWNEWNLCVDENGGPGWTGSVGNAPIMTNQAQKTYFVNPHYYTIAHFSRYVRPGAMRVGFTSTASTLESTAFLNANGTIVVVVMNRGAAAVNFKLKLGSQIVKPSIPAHSFITMIF